MKKLFLLRHAQALPTEVGATDKERRLSPKGAGDAQALGSAMLHRHYIPDIIYCSAATRTRQTMENLLEGMGGPEIETHLLDTLYDAGRAEVLNLVQETDNRNGNILVIGHNPTIYELSVTLAVDGAPALLKTLMEGFRPATMAVLECPAGEWNFFQPGKNMLIDLLASRDYNAA